MTTTNHVFPGSRKWSAWTRMATVVTAAAAVLLVAAPAASADVALTGSDPAQGATVTAALPAAALTFSEPVNGERISIALTGPAGQASLPAPSSVDTTVTQPLPPDLPNGAYTLTFNVVAADGHPLSGTVAFTMTLPVSETTSSAPSATAGTTTTTTAVQSSQAEPAPAAQDTDDSGSPLGWILGAIAVVLVLVVVGVVFVRRRRAS